MALYQAICQKVLDHVHVVATFAALTTGPKLRLFPSGTPPTATGGGTEQTTSGGYTAGGQAITYGSATAATPAVSSTTGSTSWTNMPAVTVGAIDLTDSAGTPVKLEFGTLTANKTTASGDTLTFSAAAITSSLQ